MDPNAKDASLLCEFSSGGGLKRRTEQEKAKDANKGKSKKKRITDDSGDDGHSDQDGKGFESVSEDSQRNDNSVEDMEVKFDDTDTLRDVEIEDLACWDNWDVE